jgi:hypothetical protein
VGGIFLANKTDGYKRLIRFENNRTIYGLRLGYRNPGRILKKKFKLSTSVDSKIYAENISNIDSEFIIVAFN